MNTTMTKEKEKEFKSLLDNRNHYNVIRQKIEDFATFVDTYSQTNFYFDCKNLSTAREGITLRIREKRGTFVLTAKYGQKIQHAIASLSEEIHFILSKEEAQNFIQNGIPQEHPVFEEVPVLKGKQMNHIGSLITERTDYRYKNDTISLDVNHYNGITDYEIEWETENDEFVFQTNRMLGLNFRNAKGKRKRFLKARKQVN